MWPKNVITQILQSLYDFISTLGIPKVTRQKAEKLWRNTVIKFLKQFDNLDYFDSAEDTASIVSVRIKHSETGNWMIKSELAKVFRAMTLDVGHKFIDKQEKEIATNICFTGQPVFISKDQAVLRIALGSDSLREVINEMSEKSFDEIRYGFT